MHKYCIDEMELRPIIEMEDQNKNKNIAGRTRSRSSDTARTTTEMSESCSCLLHNSVSNVKRKRKTVIGELYTHAFDHIHSAMEQGCYIEVICIFESMIADRFCRLYGSRAIDQYRTLGSILSKLRTLEKSYYKSRYEEEVSEMHERLKAAGQQRYIQDEQKEISKQFSPLIDKCPISETCKTFWEGRNDAVHCTVKKTTSKFDSGHHAVQRRAVHKSEWEKSQSEYQASAQLGRECFRKVDKIVKYFEKRRLTPP